MTFRIGSFDLLDCVRVCSHLREDDRREIAATRGELDPDGVMRLIRDCEQLQDYLVIAYDDDEPIAMMGGAPIHAGVFSGWMFATDQFPVIGSQMTKWAKRYFFAGLREMGAHRVEAHSIEGHTKSHRWIEAIGARLEAEVPQFGMNGENFLRFAYLWPEDEK